MSTSIYDLKNRLGIYKLENCNDDETNYTQKFMIDKICDILDTMGDDEIMAISDFDLIEIANKLIDNFAIDELITDIVTDEINKRTQDFFEAFNDDDLPF